MLIFFRARGGAIALIVLIIFGAGSMVGVVLTELAVMPPAVRPPGPTTPLERAQAPAPSDRGLARQAASAAPVAATLDALSTSCAVGSIGAASGWASPL